MATTTRLGLVQWVGGDPPSTIRTGNTTNMATLDNAVTVTSGVLSSIPAAGTAGRRYYATDSGIELWDTGTSWVPTGPALPIGSMALWTINSDPVDADGVTRWLVADGRAISRTTYATLNTRFSAVTYPYGNGNGSSTFNIPDTRGRVVAGPDTGVSTGAANRLRSQTVSGIANQNVIAGTGGVDAFSISAAEEPVHHHTFGGGSDHLPAATGAYGMLTFGAGGGALQAPSVSGGVVDITVTDNAGSGNSHNNSQPYLVAHHIIRVL